MEPIPVLMTAIMLILGFVLTGIATFEEDVNGLATNGVFFIGGYMMATGGNETLLVQAFLLRLKAPNTTGMTEHLAYPIA